MDNDLIRRGDVLKNLQKNSRSYNVALCAPTVHAQGEEPKPLPCPFCGEEPRINLTLSHGSGWIEAEAHIICNNCHYEFMRGRRIIDGSEIHIEGFDELMNNVAEAWNRRA